MPSVVEEVVPRQQCTGQGQGAFHLNSREEALARESAIPYQYCLVHANALHIDNVNGSLTTHNADQPHICRIGNIATGYTYLSKATAASVGLLLIGVQHGAGPIPRLLSELHDSRVKLCAIGS